MSGRRVKESERRPRNMSHANRPTLPGPQVLRNVYEPGDCLIIHHGSELWIR